MIMNNLFKVFLLIFIKNETYSVKKYNFFYTNKKKSIDKKDNVERIVLKDLFKDLLKYFPPEEIQEEKMQEKNVQKGFDKFFSQQASKYASVTKSQEDDLECKKTADIKFYDSLASLSSIKNIYELKDITIELIKEIITKLERKKLIE
jgi:hypothetical protein